MRRTTGTTSTTVASFEAELELDRGDFGVGTGNWASNAVIGSDVTVRLLVEANR